MSLRALKKRDAAIRYKKHPVPTNNRLLLKKTIEENPTNNSADNHFHQYSNSSSTSTNPTVVKRSQSVPDLFGGNKDSILSTFANGISESNLHNANSRSDSDVTNLMKKFEENANLISAKSEVCLKTISVYRTVHSNHENSSNNSDNINLAVTATRQIEGNQRPIGGTMSTISNSAAMQSRNDFPLHYCGDILNNNNGNGNHIINMSAATARRLSEQSFSMYSNMSTTMTPSDYEGRGFADNSCVRIPIIGYEVMEERARFTVYKLRVENPFTNDCWLVLRRYTDFVRLNNKLKQEFPSIHLQLPRKKLFGDNFNSVFLDNRVQGLQMFVNSVMSNEEMRNAKAVREFFCLDEPPTYSESMEECRAIFEAQEETIAHLKLQVNNKNDLILSLQQKLRNEIAEKEQLKSVISNISDCSRCSSNLTSIEKGSQIQRNLNDNINNNSNNNTNTV